MKYILAKINVNGDIVGYWTEIYNNDNGSVEGQVLNNIAECDAKVYENFEEAAANCHLIGNKCDLNLRVIPYYDEKSLVNNKNDYNALLKILLSYSVEDIAKAIVNAIPLKESVKLSNELNCLNSGIRPSY